MKRSNRIAALALAAALGIGTLFAPAAARASEEGKRNTAIALGAAAAGLLLTQKNKLPGLVAAGAAAYAYKKYDDSVRARHRWEGDYGYNDNRYNRNYDRYRGDNYGDNGYYNDSSYRGNRDDYSDVPRQDRYHRSRNNDDNCDNGSRQYRSSRRHP